MMGISHEAFPASALGRDPAVEHSLRKTLARKNQVKLYS